jgi:hypothetical protein
LIAARLPQISEGRIIHLGERLAFYQRSPFQRLKIHSPLAVMRKRQHHGIAVIRFVGDHNIFVIIQASCPLAAIFISLGDGNVREIYFDWIVG